jgi:sn-glycerol 3-phosphate transport system ATP-binding protein
MKWLVNYVLKVVFVGGFGFVKGQFGNLNLPLRLDASLMAPQAGETFHATPKEGCLHHFNADTGKRL